MLRNVIFDWSGTLVDDLPAVLAATNHAFRLAGVPEMTLDQFRAEFRLPFKEFYDRHTPHLPLPQLEQWFHAEYRRAADDIVALPHAAGFLEFCRRRGLRAFVLSSVHREHFAAQTAKTGFAPYFERAYIEVWDKRAKILALIADHGLVPAETIFIGDMEHDMETAREGGVAGCAVLTGYNSLAQLEASRPRLIVRHLGELQALLEACDLDLEGRFPAAAPGPA